MKLFILSIALMITNTYAFTSDDLLHPVAHGAGSYLITHTSEVVCKKLTNYDRTTCSIVGGVIATSAGILIEKTQPKEANHMKSYLQNASGVLLAIGVIHIDF